MDGPRAAEILRQAVATLPPHCDAEIAFFGGSFTGIEKERQQALLAAAQPYLENGRAGGIRLSTRPDLIDRQTVDWLKERGVTSIELGAQSMDEEVLRQSGRGHTPADVERASGIIREAGLELGLQMMVGLPGDTREKCQHTAREIIRLGAQTTRIYPTLVLRGTPLAEMYQRGEYQPLELEQALEWCADLLSMMRRAQVKVLRLGLMAEENLSPQRDLLAGPWHPAFGELVRGRVLRRQAEGLFCCRLQGDQVVLRVHPKEVSAFVGPGRSNVDFLRQRFGLRTLTVHADETLPRGVVRREE